MSSHPFFIVQLRMPTGNVLLQHLVLAAEIAANMALWGLLAWVVGRQF